MICACLVAGEVVEIGDVVDDLRVVHQNRQQLVETPERHRVAPETLFRQTEVEKRCGTRRVLLDGVLIVDPASLEVALLEVDVSPVDESRRVVPVDAEGNFREGFGLLASGGVLGGYQFVQEGEVCRGRSNGDLRIAQFPLQVSQSGSCLGEPLLPEVPDDLFDLDVDAEMLKLRQLYLFDGPIEA